MEDVRRFLKKYGFLIVLMVIIVIMGSIVFGKRDLEKNTEEAWEPPVIIEHTEAEKEEESIECFVEASGDPAEDLIEEKSDSVSILTAEEEQNLQVNFRLLGKW